MIKNNSILTQLVVPTSFAECMTYEKQILWLKKEIDSLSVGGDPAVIADLQKQIAAVDSQVKELDKKLDSYGIEAIEQSITQLEANVKLVTDSLKEKQDKLTFDTAPTANSTNPVFSGGIHQAIHDEGARVEQLVNNKVDESTFNTAIQNITDNYATDADVQTATAGLATKAELETATAGLATKAEIANKQDKLTFDVAPTADSNNPVTSGGIYTALQNVSPTGQIDDTVTSDSENPVKSSGIFQYVAEGLNEKQDELTFDSKPIQGSSNPITSGGVYTALNHISPTVQLDDTVSADSENAVKSSGIYTFVTGATVNLATKSEISDMLTQSDARSTYATKNEMDSKQDKLTFDDAPTQGSYNPVTSAGIYNALQNAGGGSGSGSVKLLELTGLENSLRQSLHMFNSTAKEVIDDNPSIVTISSQSLRIYAVDDGLPAPGNVSGYIKNHVPLFVNMVFEGTYASELEISDLLIGINNTFKRRGDVDIYLEPVINNGEFLNASITTMSLNGGEIHYNDIYNTNATSVVIDNLNSAAAEVEPVVSLSKGMQFKFNVLWCRHASFVSKNEFSLTDL